MFLSYRRGQWFLYSTKPSVPTAVSWVKVPVVERVAVQAHAWEKPWQTRGMAADLNTRPGTANAAMQSLLKRPHVTRQAGKAGKVHLCDAETLLPLCGRPLANGGLPCDNGQFVFHDSGATVASCPGGPVQSCSFWSSPPS